MLIGADLSAKVIDRLTSTTECSGSLSLRMSLLNARSIANKSFIFTIFSTSEGLDLMFQTETWQKSLDFTSLIELCPPHCNFICTLRSSGRGGGLAVIIGFDKVVMVGDFNIHVDDTSSSFASDFVNATESFILSCVWSHACLGSHFGSCFFSWFKRSLCLLRVACLLPCLCLV